MYDHSQDHDISPFFRHFAARIKLGIRRKQVTLGRERLVSLAKRESVAVVWATTDLSRHAKGKLELVCRKYDIPLVLKGSAGDIGLLTGQPSVKVYVVKRSFSGINQILRDIEDE